MVKGNITRELSTKNKPVFLLMDAILGVLIFVLIYHLFLRNMAEGFNKFIWIFVSNLLSGFFASKIAYLIYRKRLGTYKFYDLKSYYPSYFGRNLLIALIYSIFIYFYVIEILYNSYPFYLFLIWVLGLKLFIYLIAYLLISEATKN